MCRSCISLFAVLLFGSLPSHASAGDGNPEPMRAFFVGGNVYHSTKETWNSLSFTDLGEKRNQRQLVSFSGQGGRPRWYFGYGHI